MTAADKFAIFALIVIGRILASMTAIVGSIYLSTQQLFIPSILLMLLAWRLGRILVKE